METDESVDLWTLMGEERELVAAQVAAAAPRLFAVCELERDENDGELVAGHITGWGLAGDDEVQVLCANGQRFTMGSLDETMWLMSLDGSEMGVIWVSPS